MDAPDIRREAFRVCGRGYSQVVKTIGCSTCGWSELIPDVDDEGLALFGGEGLVAEHTAEACAARQADQLRRNRR